MSITMTREQRYQLRHLELERAGHPRNPGELDLLEAAAFIAGEQVTDHPACVDRTVIYLGLGVNDVLDWDERQSLKALVPFMIGTADDGQGMRRLCLALRWAATTLAPELVGRLGYWDHAERIDQWRKTLPLYPDGAWTPVLNLLEQARLAVRGAYERTDWTGLEVQAQEHVDVQNMLGRIVAALTDFVDPEFTYGEADQIAGTLGEIFTVQLRYNWTPLHPILVRFMADLVHTGRSYL